MHFSGLFLFLLFSYACDTFQRLKDPLWNLVSQSKHSVHTFYYPSQLMKDPPCAPFLWHVVHSSKFLYLGPGHAEPKHVWFLFSAAIALYWPLLFANWDWRFR